MGRGWTSIGKGQTCTFLLALSSIKLFGFPSGIIRYNLNDTENISVAPAQGWRAQIEKCKQFMLSSIKLLLTRLSQVASGLLHVGVRSLSLSLSLFIYLSIYLSIPLSLCIHIYIYTHIHIHKTYIYIYIDRERERQRHICVYMYAYIHVCMYIYIYTHM